MNGLYDELRIAMHSIWQRRWLALAVAWGIAILGWLVVSQLPNRYEAKARVFVQMGQVLSAKVGINAQEQQNDVDTIRQTLTSAVNLEKVVRGTDLANTVAGPQDIADRVAGLQTNIKIVAQQNNLFEITASASSPKLAKQIVDKLISIFVDQNLSDDRNETQTTLRFLDSQVEQMQNRLADADAKRTAFQTQYLGALPGTGTLQDRMSAARTQMAQIDGDLAGAQTSLAAINGQMAGTQANVAGAGGVVGGPARARLAAIEGQLADARAKGYTESHPDVIALRSQLAAARAAANSEPLGAGGGGQPNPVYLSLRSMQADKQAAVAALSARKAQLQGDMNAIMAKLNGDPAVASEQSQIERDYQVLKDQYDKVLGDREELRVRAQAQAQTDAIKFRTIDPPAAPRAPAAPNRPVLLFGVLFLAIGGGVATAFGMAQLKATFPTAGRLEKATGLPVIGSISERVSRVEASLRKRKLVLFAGAAAGLGVAFVGLLGVEMLMRGLAA
ncbi:XrtA system polysaccharide chain length determinant [Sphingomonas bacterium]|uniref:XrtA system polysaccharide chain length determinant n=1 Tax=Sphingomonas bacterium TaxID=1895847 RepID=UPI002627FA4C|nr:XrtA system polysaccharide chain length determinant [Sphingomonas bacterium]MDB5678006.1 chain-length determining protein [Sphingomonas bacterium]